MKTTRRPLLALSLLSIVTFIGGIISAREGPAAGVIGEINKSTKEIIIKSPQAAQHIRMGDRLYVRIGGKAAVMRVVFPMQTLVKCALEAKYAAYFGTLGKGMQVFRYMDGIDGEQGGPGTEPPSGSARNVGGIDFIYVGGGDFMMGSPMGEGDAHEHPQHRVTVTGFWMGKCEVTQGQYAAVMGSNPSHVKDDPRRPVDNVSWHDAVAFCGKFGKRHGVAVRLPREAEWEYACRAASTTRFYWGGEINDDYLWYFGNSKHNSHPVGVKLPNAFGLFDMAGNVLEWCADWYGENYYSQSPDIDPAGAASGYARVLRGGSWDDGGVQFIRSAYRSYWGPENRSPITGFRLVFN